MPIYGYVCEQCGRETEVLQGINDPPLRSCPHCMGPVRKQLYPAGVIFKGSGFYTTDYKGKSSSSSSDGGSSSSSSSSSSSESSSKSDSSSSKRASTKDD
jgi:putative FmdB family regulatory protein